MRKSPLNLTNILIYITAAFFLHVVTFWCAPVFSIEDVDRSHLIVCIEDGGSLETADDPKNASFQCAQDQNITYLLFVDNIRNRVITEDYVFLGNNCFSKLSPRSPPVL